MSQNVTGFTPNESPVHPHPSPGPGPAPVAPPVIARPGASPIFPAREGALCGRGRADGLQPVPQPRPPS